MEESHVNELKDYIDDILLWVHVKQKIIKSEYIQKIEEINTICNEIIEKYEDKDIFEPNNIIKSVKTKKSELEQLCYAIMSGIMANMFNVEKEEIDKLKNKVEETLDWIIDIDIKSRKAELQNEIYDISEKDYQEKIDDLNELCNELYRSMLDINFTKENNDIILDEDILLGNNEIYILGEENNSGTSIASLMKNK